MKKNNIIITLLILIIIGGCIYYFYNNSSKDNKKNNNSNITSNIKSNSSSNSNIINDNSNLNEIENKSNENSNIEQDNSNIVSNFNSNIKSNINSNSNKSNKNSNSNSNKFNSNSNTPKSNSNSNDNSLATNGTFSGIFQNNTHKVHMLQIGNKVHFYITKRNLTEGKTDASITIHGNVSGNVVTANEYNIKFVLKEKGIEFTSTHPIIPNGYIPKIAQYTNTDYFVEFMHGNTKGNRGIYQNKYGTVKIYQKYDNDLGVTISVKRKNAYDDVTRNKTITGSTNLSWNSSANAWREGNYGKDCSNETYCSWISISISGNSLSIESDSSTMNNIYFHAGKYFDENKNKAEPNANKYTKINDYTIDQIVKDVF